MKKKKTTSYIIWGLALLSFVLSIIFWLLVFATRKPHKDSEVPIQNITEEAIDYKAVDKAEIHIGNNYWDANIWGVNDCSVDGPFRTDTLVIISTDKTIYFDND